LSALAATQPEPIAPRRRPEITRWNRTLKRAVDLSVAAVALVFAAPLIAILALRIMLHDGGPAFYRRRVVGLKGEFDAFKLRTMRVDADEVLRADPELLRQFEVNFKLRHDPRVTSVGVVLRRTGADELPQLWNVFKGEMSLVGPRMITAAELKKYREASWIFECMKPGLTGHWQVHGDPTAGYDRRISMDRFYAENWSLLFDLKILMRTPARVLRGSGV
jgi:exopolysaccharide production protein ExoY